MNGAGGALLRGTAMPGIYLHLPFCRVHCSYCPFAISTDLTVQDRYTDALLRELEARRLDGPVETVYLGGGTPSRTSLANLRRIFDAIEEHHHPAAGAEISMEANPEDVDERAIAGWLELGVTRLSIGVQSFDDAELRAIGRIHDRATAASSVARAVAAGVATNLDLILGLPGQTAASFRETLATALSLDPGHLSLYMLDLEERTPLQVQAERGRVTLPDDALVADLYQEAVETLERAGLAQYEVSNFAREGERCRHNLTYWERGEYLGLGMAAHSFRGNVRSANTRDIRRYVDLAPDATDFTETLGEGEIRRETIFLELRQTPGIRSELLAHLCGDEGQAWAERGLGEGWLRRREDRLAFTSAGFLRSNDYISDLF